MNKESEMSKAFYNFPEFALALLAIAIAVVVFFELFVRVIFHVSVFGYVGDLTKLFMVWISLVGAAVGVKRGSHFVFPIVADKLGSRFTPYLSIFAHIIIMSFAIIMVITGLKMAFLALNETYPALGISLFWQNLAVPVSGALMFPYCVGVLRSQFRAIATGETVETKDYVHRLIDEMELEQPSSLEGDENVV
jgi:TRAP-type C4-dicarboxylate transport system permease small subunit